ncbi:MAG: chromate efflux transporter [Betaproteobacteria bacterium]|nr:chromate efflux transporter [Betaproteobacteria bacterium]
MTAAPPRAAVPFAGALRFWLKLGCISFGGPAGQIAIMHRELVEERRWISEKRFLHALNYCMVLPGPEAQQLATYIGWLMHGVRGGLAAGGLFVLPSLILLIALSWLYVRYAQLPLVAGLFAGIKPVVVAVVVFAAWRVAVRTLHTKLLSVIALLSFAAMASGRVPFPAVLALAALAGWVGSHQLAAAIARKGHAASASHAHLRALIDDDTPTPPHAVFRSWRLATVLLIGVGGGAAVAAMVWLHQPGGPLSHMAAFFTQAALLTFGGAYAVLPYVFQGAVHQYQWLSAGQMIDGLALGESTPGPLIMIVAFVGFLGGWNAAAGDVNTAWPLAVAGACVATFFTFLPSFLFIFAGAPLVERTRSTSFLAAPLTAITAAVVGVIASLAVVFAWHVWWPRASAAQLFSGGVEWFALVLSALAAFALFRLHWGVMPVIGAGALAGALRALLA